MKKRFLLLLAGGSAAAFLLRLLQQFKGFEPDTGLPVRGSIWGMLLCAVLLLFSLSWIAAVRPLPKDDQPDLPQAFAMDKNALLLPIGGLFLLVLSGLADLFTGLLPHTAQAITADGTMISVAAVGDVSPKTMLFLGLLTLIGAASLFPAVLSCRKREEQAPFNGQLLLVMPVMLVVRLVLVYRIHSVNPSPAVYAVELLALVLLTMGFYRLSAFGCGVGNTRRFVLFSGLSVAFSAAALADGSGLGTTLFFLGSGVLLLGFLLARLTSAEN